MGDCVETQSHPGGRSEIGYASLLLFHANRAILCRLSFAFRFPPSKVRAYIGLLSINKVTDVTA